MQIPNHKYEENLTSILVVVVELQSLLVYKFVMVNSHSRASLIVVVIELQSLLVYKFVMVNM
jgi:hypothetical protein